MKIWFSSEAKSAGAKRYFACVQETMVDKDGKPVYIPTPAPVAEPAPEVIPEAVPEVEAVAPVEESTPAPAAEPVTVIVEAPARDDSAVLNMMNELVNRLDTLNEILSSRKEEPVVVPVVVPAEPKAEEPVEEPVVEEAVEEVAEEPAVEEVVEEVAATEYIEVPAEDVNAITAILEDQPAEVAPVEGEEKAPAVRSRCFAEKMRDASEIIQDRYDELKNYALRFRKLKARISRKFDSINQGRFQFVKLSVAGKTLKLYLNMDINTTDPKFHCKDMSDKKTYVTVPTMLRIKSGRAVKYAKILIDQCAEQHGLLERRKPFVVDAMALIEESLASKGLPTGNEDDDFDVADDAE